MKISNLALSASVDHSARCSIVSVCVNYVLQQEPALLIRVECWSHLSTNVVR